MATRYAKSTLSDWPCPDPNCGNVNFARRDACNRCGLAKPFEKKPSGSKKIGREIGKSLAEKSKGLFSAEDWQCTHCGNVNWARRNTCNICNSSKFGKVEERTGLGGGYNERENVEYVERDESDGEYDEFGRKKKKFRGQLTSGNSSDDEKGVTAKNPKDTDEVIEKASKINKSHVVDASINAEDDFSSRGQSKNIDSPKMQTQLTSPALRVDAETDDEEEDEDEDLSKYDLDAASDLVEENREEADVEDENDATASSSDTSSNKGSSDASSSDSEANSDSRTRSPLSDEQADKNDQQATKRPLRSRTNGRSTAKKRKTNSSSSSSGSTSGSASDDSEDNEDPKSNKLNTTSTIKSLKSTTKAYTSTLTKTSASKKQTSDSEDDDQKAIPLPQS